MRTRLLALAPAKEATVYKTATCGCCKKWVEHMEKSGYKVTAHDVPDVGVVQEALRRAGVARLVPHRHRDRADTSSRGTFRRTSSTSSIAQTRRRTSSGSRFRECRPGRPVWKGGTPRSTTSSPSTRPGRPGSSRNADRQPADLPHARSSCHRGRGCIATARSRFRILNFRRRCCFQMHPIRFTSVIRIFAVRRLAPHSGYACAPRSRFVDRTRASASCTGARCAAASISTRRRRR